MRATSAAVEVAEIVRGQRREQRHPDVGRRRAVARARGVAVLLVVVGRQPAVGFGDERFEVAPGLARRPAQEGTLAIVERALRARRPGRLSQ